MSSTSFSFTEPKSATAIARLIMTPAMVDHMRDILEQYQRDADNQRAIDTEDILSRIARARHDPRCDRQAVQRFERELRLYSTAVSRLTGDCSDDHLRAFHRDYAQKHGDPLAGKTSKISAKISANVANNRVAQSSEA